MKDDTQRLLDELQEALLEEPPAEPAPQKSAPRESKSAKAQKQRDKTMTTLMFIASGLCVGIVGVLIYWLVAYL